MGHSHALAELADPALDQDALEADIRAIKQNFLGSSLYGINNTHKLAGSPSIPLLRRRYEST